MRFNAPPGWPVRPGFTPDDRWQPDPSWPAAPAGWVFWIDVDDEPKWSRGPDEAEARATSPPRTPRRNSRALLLTAAAAAAITALVTGVILTRSGVASWDQQPERTAPVEDVSESPGRDSAPSAESAVDPETASAAKLREIADRDREYVARRLADIWVPQLSSKRPGVIDEGMVWDNALTLQEHLRLRERYGAKLLWSGEWSTFDAPNFWVTVAPITFPNARAALSWCTQEGFDSLHCYAKLVSTTHPIRGSTAHNK